MTGVPAGGVHPGVGEQVGHHLAQPPLVALHDDRTVGDDERHRAVGVDGTGVLGRVGRHRHEVDGEALERSTLVEAGQHEQVVDQLGHAPDSAWMRRSASARAAGSSRAPACMRSV